MNWIPGNWEAVSKTKRQQWSSPDLQIPSTKLLSHFICRSNDSQNLLKYVGNHHILIFMSVSVFFNIILYLHNSAWFKTQICSKINLKKKISIACCFSLFIFSVWLISVVQVIEQVSTMKMVRVNIINKIKTRFQLFYLNKLSSSIAYGLIYCQ